MNIFRVLTASAILAAAGAASAAELEGTIERVNLDRKTFEIEGITLHVTDETEFEDGLEGFIDLVSGLDVEVDFEFEDGRHVATEIEPGDG